MSTKNMQVVQILPDLHSKCNLLICFADVAKRLPCHSMVMQKPLLYQLITPLASTLKELTETNNSCVVLGRTEIELTTLISMSLNPLSLFRNKSIKSDSL